MFTLLFVLLSFLHLWPSIWNTFLSPEICPLEFLYCGSVSDCLPFLSALKCIFFTVFLNSNFARFRILGWLLFSFSTLFTVVYGLALHPFYFYFIAILLKVIHLFFAHFQDFLCLLIFCTVMWQWEIYLGWITFFLYYLPVFYLYLNIFQEHEHAL